MVGEKGHGDEYGIGSPESFSVLELAQMFTDNIVMLPERQGNRMESICDTSRIEKEFGWKAEHTVREYIDSLKTVKK
jgi:UDP-glucose 4-epimerase